MPIKLIATLLLVILVAVFTGFNLSNRCTIWFFHNFENIPVFAALFGAFLAGVVVTLPFTFGKKKEMKTEKPEKKKKGKSPSDDATVIVPPEN